MRPKMVIGFAAETTSLEKNAVQKLKDGIKSNNVMEIRDALHTLRPNLAHLDLTDLANELPTVDKVNFNEVITKKISTIEGILNEIKEGLKNKLPQMRSS